ncbi:MAG: hypothetical protein KME34_10225 [Candidatus Thiodiazotropha sp. (ex Codakia orbicularis)]|nr:hypothetical protein [Candidatus Thiodiazotropha sp. (ex Codakia orbicularis)]
MDDLKAWRVLLFCCLGCWGDLALCGDAGALGAARFKAGMQAPSPGLEAVIPGGHGLLQAMPPWGYQKPALQEVVDDILAAMDINAQHFDDIVGFPTREDYYRVYQGQVFSRRGYAQALKHGAGARIQAQLDRVLAGVVRGEKYYVADEGRADQSDRVGSFWQEPRASQGLWIVLEKNAVLGHPVVIEVTSMTAEEIEASLVSGGLRPTLP